MNVELSGSTVFAGQGGVSWQDGRKTLVLQHGAGMNRTVWVLLARYFARHGFNVVAADLPGHGASGGEVIPAIEDQATHLWKLLDHLQETAGLPEGPVILGGHSMGALLVAEAAGQQPERVEHLLLLGAGYPMPVGSALLDAAKADDHSAIDMITLYSHCYESQLGHNAVAGISVLNSAMALLEQSRPGVLFADLSACNAYRGLESAAAALGPGRSTVIVGEADRMTPIKPSRNLAELLDASLVIVPGCGHMLMSEQPERTLQALRQALAVLPR